MVQPIMTKMREELGDRRRQLEAGEPAIFSMVDKLDDEKLRVLLAELTGKRSGITQYVRVQQLAHLLVPELGHLDEAAGWMRHMKVEIVQLFADCMVAELMGEGLTFDLKRLEAKVRNTVSFRRGVRQGHEGPLEEPAPTPAATSSCVIG